MKKSIVAISSILQLIAAIMFIVVIRTVIMWTNGETSVGVVAIVVLIAFAVQVLSVKLKEKHSAEAETAENIMQKPKTSYGWVALAVFGVAVLIVILYAMFS